MIPLRRLLLASAALLMACGGDAPTAVDSSVSRIVITVPAVGPNVVVGDSLRLSATPLDAESRRIDSVAVRWSSSDPAIATVSERGVVHVLRVGSATVTASAGAASGSVLISGRELTTSSVQFGSRSVYVRDTLMLTATPFDQSGRPVPGRTVSFAIEDRSIVSLEGSRSLRARAPGSTRVTATIDGVAVAATISVLRHPYTLYPDSSRLLPGMARQLVAKMPIVRNDSSAILSDGVWRSSNPGVATVDGTGVITAVSTGTATISVDFDAGATISAAVRVVSFPPLRFRALSAGTYATCGLTASGEIWCWGSDRIGDLGTDEPVDRCYDLTTNPGFSISYSYFYYRCSAVPVRVKSPVLFKALSRRTGCAVAVDDRVFCWVSSPALGIASGFSSPSPGARPVNAAFGFSSFDRQCGVSLARDLWCWGTNATGEMGIGEARTVDPTVALRVSGNTQWKAVADGGRHRCGIDSAGMAYCWGEDTYGETGTGRAVWTGGPRPSNILSPTAVVAELKFSEIAAVFARTCAITTDGGIYCWGSAFTFGSGYPVPTRIGTNRASGLSMSQSSRACAIDSADRMPLCWGYVRDSAGNTVIDKPIRYGPAIPMATIAGGDVHACSIGINGLTYCTGYNRWAVLGAGQLTGSYEWGQLVAGQ